MLQFLLGVGVEWGEKKAEIQQNICEDGLEL